MANLTHFSLFFLLVPASARSQVPCCGRVSRAGQRVPVPPRHLRVPRASRTAPAGPQAPAPLTPRTRSHPAPSHGHALRPADRAAVRGGSCGRLAGASKSGAPTAPRLSLQGGNAGVGSRPPTACVPTAHGSPHTPQHAGHRLLTLRTRRGSLSGKFLAQLGSGSKASHVPRGVPGTGTSLGTGGVRGLSHRRDAADGNLSNSRCSWPVYHAVWPNCVPQIHRRKSRPRSSERGWTCRRLFTEGREVR